MSEIAKLKAELEAAKAELAQAAARLKRFASAYPCGCAGNYPGSLNYHGPDCENALAQDFVTDYLAQAEVKK